LRWLKGLVASAIEPPKDSPLRCPLNFIISSESLAGNHVEAALKPYLIENGGVLKLQRIEFKPGRNNIIITYPGLSPPSPLSARCRFLFEILTYFCRHW